MSKNSTVPNSLICSPLELQTIEVLLAYKNQHVWKIFDFIVICELGYSEVVRLLLQNPETRICKQHTLGLQRACHFNHPKVVKVILEDGRIDPSDENNTVIKYVCEYEYLEMLKILIRDGRADISIGLKAAKSVVIKQYLQFEMCKVKLFLCGNLQPNYLVGDLVDYIKYYLILSGKERT